jgi:hypothetical protein
MKGMAIDKRVARYFLCRNWRPGNTFGTRATDRLWCRKLFILNTGLSPDFPTFCPDIVAALCARGEDMSHQLKKLYKSNFHPALEAESQDYKQIITT